MPGNFTEQIFAIENSLYYNHHVAVEIFCDLMI